MSYTITPTNMQPSELKIGSVNIRRARGAESDGNGGTVPQGRIGVSVTLRRYSAGVTPDGQDVDPTVVVPDVDAWIAALFAANDALAQEAADKFAAVDEALKWLAALRGSQDGLCARPTA